MALPPQLQESEHEMGGEMNALEEVSLSNVTSTIESFPCTLSAKTIAVLSGDQKKLE
jgi:hypothetical protein